MINFTTGDILYLNVLCVSQPKLWLPVTLKDDSRQEYTPLHPPLILGRILQHLLPGPAPELECSLNSVNIEQGALSVIYCTLM